MGRLPFDASRVKGPPGEPVGGGGGAPLSVAQAAGLIASALDSSLPPRLRIVGEISGFADRTHWYFRLKDEEAVLDCVMFAAAARRAGFTPANGQKVVVTGRVEFYAKQGRTQLYAEAMEPVGAGELEQRYRALCAELKALGWFDAARKRPLPSFPRRVAVVTSKTGAALQDVLVTMKRRCPAVDVAVVDVRVQGEGAAREIAEAIGWLSREHGRLGIDAVLVTRGGGSIEDLWAFNERVVAEAIVRCAAPVVAAIGHETDTTIAELVADHRSATPTQAAVLLAPDREALAEETHRAGRRLLLGLRRAADRATHRRQDASHRLALAWQRRLGTAHQRIDRLAERLARARPEAAIAARRARLASADPGAAITGAIERRRARLEALTRELIIAGPASVLARGYSLTTDASGRLVRRVTDAPPGTALSTRVSDGTIRSRVADTSAGAEVAPGEPLPPRTPMTKPRRPRNDSADQMRLF
jgi:exodeoxyribonuclease VII large subunit